MIEGRPITRMSVAFRIPVARPTPTTASAPRASMYQAEPAAIVNEAVTTQRVTSAPTEMSKPPTRSAFVWPSATSASGMVVSRRLLRLYSVRNASCETAAYAPRPRISRPRKAIGIQPLNLGAGRESGVAVRELTTSPHSARRRPPASGDATRRWPRRSGARTAPPRGSRRRSSRATSPRPGRRDPRARAGRST